MLYNPIFDYIRRYIQEIKQEGLAYCLWVIFVGLLVGIGLKTELWILVLTGVAVWIIGGLYIGFNEAKRDKKVK